MKYIDKKILEVLSRAKQHRYEILTSFLLLVLFFLIWFKGLDILASYTDISFHLATAQGFVRAGGIVTWDFWESLPAGRPLNYPPLFHLILASFLKLGASPTTAIKLMMELTVVGGISIYAWGISKLLNIKVAFWSSTLISLSAHFLQLSVTVMPATLVVFFSPALLYFVINKKWLSYGILLTLAFYLHLFMPYLVVLTLLIYIWIFNKELFYQTLLVTLISYLFFIPWFVHIFTGGWEYIKYFSAGNSLNMWQDFIEANILIILLFSLGLILLYQKRKVIDKKYYFFLIGGAVISLPSYLIANRIVDGHLLPFIAVLAVLGMEIAKARWKYALIPIVVFYFFYTPTIRVEKRPEIILKKSSLVSFLGGKTNNQAGDPLKKYPQIIKAIKARGQDGDSITTILTYFDDISVDRDYLLSISNIFASYTKMSTLNLRSPEIIKRPVPDLAKTKFLLTDSSAYDPDIKGPNNMFFGSSILKKFMLIASIPAADDSKPSLNLYYNLSDNTTKEIRTASKFPLWAGELILATLIGVILYDNRKRAGVPVA